MERISEVFLDDPKTETSVKKLVIESVNTIICHLKNKINFLHVTSIKFITDNLLQFKESNTFTNPNLKYVSPLKFVIKFNIIIQKAFIYLSAHPTKLGVETSRQH